MYGYMKPRTKQTQQTDEYPTIPVNAIVETIVQPEFTEFEVNCEILNDLLSKISNSCFSSPENKLKINCKAIIQATADHYGFTKLELVGQIRLKDLVLARHVSFYLCRKLTPLSLPQIGRHFEDRDHTTILHGYQRVMQLLVGNHALCVDIYKIVKSLPKLD